MDSINTFGSGMNSDASKMFQDNKQYIKAENMRPVTTLGGSNGALTNIKGNLLNTIFPQVRGVYKLALGGSGSGTISITINGQNRSFSVNDSTSLADILGEIRAMSNYYDGVYASSRDFTACMSGNHIYIYQQPEYIGAGSFNSIEPVITISYSGRTLLFVDVDGNTSATQLAYVQPNDASDSLVIIGSTYINEVNYILTCGSTNNNATGQIWELSYNEITQLSTLKLLYHGNINLSKDYPVAPSAFIGRYEVPSIQRIYWSDFLNPVRSVNVKQTDLMGLDASLINSVPSVEMSIPKLSNIITGGSVDPLECNATYQCAYRLKKNGSSVSNFSITSDLVVPIPQNTDDFASSQPNFASACADLTASTTVDKCIEWTVEGIDTDYDSIEFYVVKRVYPNTMYTVHKYEEQSINGASSISSTFRNDPDVMEEITLNEFLIENSSFTHAKTIEQKDNRLFYGNVKSDLSAIIDTFDARTYRFESNSTNAKVKVLETNTGIETISLGSTADYEAIPETDDNIPAINLGMDTNDDPDYTNSSRYQRNSTIIGGEGPNIKYKFGTAVLKTDTEAAQPLYDSFTTNRGSTRDNLASPNIFKHGYRKAGLNNSNFLTSYSNGSPDQTFVTGGIKESMAFEYYNGTLKSYQLNEIYRFGILFYGKNGGTSFVRWIGDIKFPNYGEAVAPGLEGVLDNGNLISTHQTMITHAGIAYSCIPYIQFEVNIPESISSSISGYQIVRVKRNDNDKTIAAHGLVSQSMVFSGSVSTCPVSHKFAPNGTKAMDPNTGVAKYQARNDEILFESFDYLCDGNADLIAENDKLILTERYAIHNDPANNGGAVNPSGSVISNSDVLFYINKYYRHSADYNTIFKIKEAHYVDQGGSCTFTNLSNRTFRNVSPANGSSVDKHADGSPVIAIALDTTFLPLNWASFDGTTEKVVNGNCKMLAIHYRPNKLKTQYGGRTHVSRSENEYISCGAYYKSDNTSGVTTLKVFGGDIFHGILDVQRAIKTNLGVTNIDEHSQTWFFPTHGTKNIDLRVGLKVNSDLNTSSPSALTFDEYRMNEGYSLENEVHTYLPQPIGFTLTNSYFNRIYYSEPKFNAEIFDSWALIPANNYYDLDGNSGPITSLITLRNNMYAIQESAIAMLQINPSSVVVDDNNQSLRIGDGDVLSKHNYASVDIGSRHQWSVSKSPTHITFVDARFNKIYLFDGQNLTPLSDAKGARGFMNKVMNGNILSYDNPVTGKGVLTTYDFNNNEFLYTFKNYRIEIVYIGVVPVPTVVIDNYTLAFSDIVGAFTSFYSATPYIYINNRSRIYSPSAYNSGVTSKLYLHDKGAYGSFYDEIHPSTVKVNINPSAAITKSFDNLSWVSDATSEDGLADEVNDATGSISKVAKPTDTLTRVRCYNEYQNSDWITLDLTPSTGNVRKTEQGFNIQVPRNKVNYDANSSGTSSIFDPAVLTKTSFGERMRDKNLIVDLEYDNTTGSRFILHALKSSFRVSAR